MFASQEQEDDYLANEVNNEYMFVDGDQLIKKKKTVKSIKYLIWDFMNPPNKTYENKYSINGRFDFILS